MEDMSIPSKPTAFVAWLAARYPAIAGLADEHHKEYDELLPHILFGDITRYASDLARSASGDADPPTN
jgi:hypothetical protein